MNKIYYCLILLGFVPIPGKSQNNIKGKVVSPDREPLVGATVRIMNTSKGVVTDFEGNFEIAGVQKNERIIVSFVGYVNDTLSAVSGTPLSIVLEEDSEKLDEVIVKGRSSTIDEMQPILNELISEKELLKAACCNLSESFETNASVDVSFADAVTGTKTIRMLGLDGRYVLISREGIPHVRGLNSRYGLICVPGTWIQSIDVGKGAGTVINGYESMTGQINVEFKKPENSEKWYLNGYVNSLGRFEFNTNHSTEISDKWDAAILLNTQYLGFEIDGNDDGFMDLPKSRMINFLNRYKYKGDQVESQIGIQYMKSELAGGQLGYGFGDDLLTNPIYGFKHDDQRIELFGKIGMIFPGKPYQSWGFQYSVSYQEFDGGAGRRLYQGSERTAYGNLIYQNIIRNTRHQYKAGISYLFDGFDERFVSQLNTTLDSTFSRNESVPGIFYEYNYIPNDDLTLVAGVRTDFNNLYGTYFTPRLHLRYAFNDHWTIRLSGGKGYRTPNAIMENSQVLVSSRRLIIEEEPKPEITWNFGGSLATRIDIDEKPMNIVADYFHTRFENQLIYDQDQSSSSLAIYNLDGKSFAHSLQVEAQYEIYHNLDLKAAYKYYNVQMTTNGKLQQMPFVSRDRLFINLAYATKYDTWKADFTWNWNGRKRLPDTSENPEQFQRATFSPDFSILNAQISRGFRWGSIYLGGENVLNFKQNDPIVDPENPFGNNFDASMVWGPIAGRVVYAGIRYKVK
ncbi:MAG: TonB-dependent receptor [Cytophagales bacterium]|nr:TonB-dependent receptor [Cytophagales bacterium]